MANKAAISFSLKLSPQASVLMRKFGAPQELGQALATELDSLNEDSLNEIRGRLNVAGNSKRGKKESKTGDYPFPHKITSRLQNSMGKTNAVITGNVTKIINVASVIGSGVGQGKEAVRYAALQEFGGQVNVPSRPRRSRNPKYLKSHSKSTKAFTFSVRARSFLRSTITERQFIYNRRLSRTVKNYFGGQN